MSQNIISFLHRKSVPRMVVGVEPCLDFGFIVDSDGSDFVVGEGVVVAEVLEGSAMEREVFGESFVVNESLTIECGTNVFGNSINHLGKFTGISKE